MLQTVNFHIPVNAAQVNLAVIHTEHKAYLQK
jgi:hypothetical protein